MKRLDKTKKKLITSVAICLVITIFFGVFRFNPFVNSIRNTSYGIIATVKYSLFDYPVTSIYNVFTDLTNLWQVKDENDRLRSELAMVEQYKNEITFQDERIKELEAMIGLKSSQNEYRLIGAEVTSRSYETWNDLITIDVGSADGVRLDQAVVTPEGVIGRVEAVNSNSATVRLLVTKNAVNKVSVKLKLSDGNIVHGILDYYDLENRAFIVNLLEANITVDSGTAIVTSGLGGVFPSDLSIGTVVSTVEMHNDLVTKLLVAPAADFKNFNFVFVVSKGDNQ